MKPRRIKLDIASPYFSTLVKRFWTYVNKTAGSCWPWIGSHVSAGYGIFWGGRENRNILATRFMWLVSRGTDPGEMYVLHRCDNPQCVNPEHLFLGTKSDNAIDMVSKGRRNQPELKRRSYKGDGAPTHKLTREQVIEMRSMYAAGGWTHKELATIFPVRKSTVAQIISRRSWANI